MKISSESLPKYQEVGLALFASYSMSDSIHLISKATEGTSKELRSIIRYEFLFFRFFLIYFILCENCGEKNIKNQIFNFFISTIYDRFAYNKKIEWLFDSPAELVETSRERLKVYIDILKITLKETRDCEEDVSKKIVITFIFALRLLYPHIKIDEGTIPPSVLIIIKTEFNIFSEYINKLLKEKGLKYAEEYQSEKQA